MSKTPRQLVVEWIEEKKLNEDAGILPVLAIPTALAATSAVRGLSGMHGQYADKRWDTGQAGPIRHDDVEFAKNYPTGYSLGDTIKHWIIGKSGNDKEGEIQNAEEMHRYDVHYGEPKAIELNHGYDPLGGVRGGIPVNPDKKDVLSFVHGVLLHARDTNQEFAEPEDDEDQDHEHYYNVNTAAADHLVKNDVLPQWGDSNHADGHYLDTVHVGKDNGLIATYRENRPRGLLFRKKIDY